LPFQRFSVSALQHFRFLETGAGFNTIPTGREKSLALFTRLS
jgi:hypothetical protein